jgi:hypothetical protein
MQSTSAEFAAIMGDQNGAKFAKRKIEYKRRYWNGAAYVYEASYQILYDDDILSVTPIAWRLDSRQQNKILASNVTLRLKNTDWKWLLENITSGIFKPDGTATEGYDDFRTEFKISYGYLLSSGSYEYIPLFVGYATDFLFSSDTMAAEIQVEGRELLLEHANAQNVNTPYTLQAAVPAVGTGSLLTFETKKSVWEISQVRVNGVVKVQGADYTLEDMNLGDTAAKIIFTIAPTSGHAVDWNGTQWLRDQRISTLVEYLCDEAGITSPERVITEPTFPGVSQFSEYGSASEWNAATKVNTNSFFLPGFLQIGTLIGNNGFESGVFGSDWAVATNTPGSGSSSAAVVSASPTAYEGTYSARMILGEDSETATFTGKAIVMLLSTATAPTTFPPAGTYKILSNTGSVWTEETIVHPGGVKYLHFAIYDETDNGLRAVITHQTPSSVPQTISFHYQARSPISINPSYIFSIDDVRMRAIVANGTTETTEIDLLSTPTAWLPLVHLTTLNGGTVSFETKTAAISGGPYSSYVATDGSLIPQSPVNRYIKVKIYMNHNGTNSNGPEMDYLRIAFLGSNLFIGHADFKSKTCLSAIQRLAEISNCEFGFRGNGNFFFRPKGVSPTAVLNMTEGNYISKLRSLRRGYDFVQNVVAITYGPYYHEERVDTQSPALDEPNSEQRFYPVLLAKSINEFLFSNNANFAEAIAKNYFEDFSPAKKRWIAETRIIPPLELSDVLSSAFYDSPLRKNAVFGDILNTDPAFGPDYRNILRATLGKTLGISFNTDNGTCSIELQEVLTS